MTQRDGSSVFKTWPLYFFSGINNIKIIRRKDCISDTNNTGELSSCVVYSIISVKGSEISK